MERSPGPDRGVRPARPRTTSVAHNAAVTELVASAKAGKALDTGKAATAVAAAVEARALADARKVIITDALGQAERDAMGAFHANVTGIIPALRPRYTELTARLTELAQLIPPAQLMGVPCISPRKRGPPTSRPPTTRSSPPSS